MPWFFNDFSIEKMNLIQTKNKIVSLFGNNPKKVLSVYFTAGYPHLHDTMEVVSALQEGGADIIEVGIPYSDPVADGPTIQQSNKQALDNGISLRLIFEQLADLRKQVQIPVVLMGYINPVLQYGLEAFCRKCSETGIYGVILPDLPMQEYLDEYKDIFEKYGLVNIFLITPQTSAERIRQIDEHSQGFIYMVSSASTTGAKAEVTDEQERYFERVNAMALRNPRLIGFGISSKQTFDRACRYASGAIIGSAFIKVLQQSKNITNDTVHFIQSIKGK